MCYHMECILPTSTNWEVPYRREKAPISSSSLPQITAYFGDKKIQLFGVFIDSSAAPWHTHSKYIYGSKAAGREKSAPNVTKQPSLKESYSPNDWS